MRNNKELEIRGLGSSFQILQAHYIPNRAVFTNCIFHNDAATNAKGLPIIFRKPSGYNGVYISSYICCTVTVILEIDRNLCSMQIALLQWQVIQLQFLVVDPGISEPWGAAELLGSGNCFDAPSHIHRVGEGRAENKKTYSTHCLLTTIKVYAYMLCSQNDCKNIPPKFSNTGICSLELYTGPGSACHFRQYCR